jgi:uncharacterized protein YgfB (UPF0149 family)
MLGLLSDTDLRFEPLLPSAETPVDVRADALVEWCRGFLGGIGLAGTNQTHGLSPDCAEILRDFSTIAGSRFEYADSEEDESALAEVIEFIRRRRAVAAFRTDRRRAARPGDVALSTGEGLGARDQEIKIVPTHCHALINHNSLLFFFR